MDFSPGKFPIEHLQPEVYLSFLGGVTDLGAYFSEF